MDQARIQGLIAHYHKLPLEELANLDEERHQLSGEEATALDAVMRAEDMREPTARAIEKRDAKKQRRFRVGFIAFILYIGICAPLTAWFEKVIPNASALANGLGVGIAWITSSAMYFLWERIKG